MQQVVCMFAGACCTAAHRACQLGLSQLVQQLLEAGHDVNSATEGTQLTPLHIACKHGHEHVVRLLLQQPAVDVDAETAPDMGVSVRQVRSSCSFEYLCTQQCIPTVCILHPTVCLLARLLRKAFRMVTQTLLFLNWHACSAYSWCCCLAHSLRLQLRPLHKAVAYGHTEVVRLLLEAGVDATAPTGIEANQNTALHLAAINGFVDIVQLLLQQPSMVDLAWDFNIKGQTALDLAVREGHEQVCVVDVLVYKHTSVATEPRLWWLSNAGLAWS
jgi:ankyrin repeat protein